MTGRPTSYPPHSTQVTLESFAGGACGAATWRQILPPHRISVTAKTPILVALGVHLTGGGFDTPGVWLTMALAAALWFSLYALNEALDLTWEQGLTVDSRRMALLYALPPALCCAAMTISSALFWCFALMAAGQAAYCVRPVRLKRYWWAILVLSGVLNPLLRLQCGALWGSHGIPVAAGLTLVSLHLGATIRARVLLRDRDLGFSYRVAPAHAEWVGMGFTLLGLAGCVILWYQGSIPRLFAPFVALGVAFSLYAWSGRIQSISRLRQGWMWFAVFSLLALAELVLRM